MSKPNVGDSPAILLSDSSGPTSHLAPGLRLFPLGNYLIFYLPEPEGIQVIRVIHGARDYGPEFF